VGDMNILKLINESLHSFVVRHQLGLTYLIYTIDLSNNELRITIG
jgi:hypothetical protein